MGLPIFFLGDTMATVAQIAANRINAQKSTGPRSVEGKAASSMNAFKHGVDAASIVIPGEDPAAYERMAAEHIHDVGPRTALERFEVDNLIRADWQCRRLVRIEANLYRQLLAEGQTPEEIDVTVLRDSPTGRLLLKVLAQIAYQQRVHSRALAELRRLRREAAQADMDEIESAHEIPELPAMMAEARERYRQRNEPNSTPKPAPAAALDNPALRL